MGALSGVAGAGDVRRARERPILGNALGCCRRTDQVVGSHCQSGTVPRVRNREAGSRLLRPARSYARAAFFMEVCLGKNRNRFRSPPIPHRQTIQCRPQNWNRRKREIMRLWRFRLMYRCDPAAQAISCSSSRQGWRIHQIRMSGLGRD